MIVRCDEERFKDMPSFRPEDGPCGRVYDDAENSTVCPHEPLPAGGVIVFSQGKDGLKIREELYGRKNIDTRRIQK